MCDIHSACHVKRVCCGIESLSCGIRSFSCEAKRFSCNQITVSCGTQSISCGTACQVVWMMNAACRAGSMRFIHPTRPCHDGMRRRLTAHGCRR